MLQQVPGRNGTLLGLITHFHYTTIPHNYRKMRLGLLFFIQNTFEVFGGMETGS